MNVTLTSDILLLKELSIAKRLKELRAQKGCSQDDVFIDTDIHVGRLEIGVKIPSVSTLSDLCDDDGITLEEFLRGVNSK